MKTSEIHTTRKENLIVLLNLCLVLLYFIHQLFPREIIENFYYVNASSYVLTLSTSLIILIFSITSYVVLSAKSKLTKFSFFPVIAFWTYMLAVHIFSGNGQGNSTISTISVSFLIITAILVIGSTYGVLFRDNQLIADNTQLREENETLKMKLQEVQKPA